MKCYLFIYFSFRFVRVIIINVPLTYKSHYNQRFLRVKDFGLFIFQSLETSLIFPCFLNKITNK